jgi:beta propeller repeat protein
MEWDIYAFDLTTHQQIHTTDKSDQVEPAIHGNKVVWKDLDNSTEQSPMYTYSSAGTYKVNLTVSKAYGTNSKIATKVVSNQPAAVRPVANFNTDVTSGYAPLSVQFTDLSENATARKWDF